MTAELAGYLARLGVDVAPADLPPILATLRLLHRVHVLGIGYDNLDIMLARPPSVTPASALRHVVDTGRAGYCLGHNGALEAVLVALGFDVERRHGRAWFDPAQRESTDLNHLALSPALSSSIHFWRRDGGDGGWRRRRGPGRSRSARPAPAAPCSTQRWCCSTVTATSGSAPPPWCGAHVSTGTFYRYFDDKADVFAALRDEAVRAISDDLMVSVVGALDDDLPGAMRSVVETLVAGFERHAPVMRALVDQAPTGSNADVLPEIEADLHQLASLLPRRHLPDLPPERLEAVVFMLMGVLVSTCLRVALQRPDGVDRAELVDLSVTMLAAGMTSLTAIGSSA